MPKVWWKGPIYFIILINNDNMDYENAKTGERLEIEYYSDDNDNPRQWDNMGTMILNHKNYNLGDDDYGIETYEELVDYLKEQEAEIVVKVWGYDHGGLSISTTRSGQFADEWDSGLLGVIYATKNDILENFTGWNSYGIRKPMRKYLTKKLRKMATRSLESEVRTYNRYLNNEIVCYTLYDKDGKEIDRLSGIYILDNEDELDAVLSEIGSKREDWES